MRPVPLGGKTTLLKEPAGEEPSGSSTWRRKRGAAFFVFSVVQIKKILNWLNIIHGLVVDFT